MVVLKDVEVGWRYWDIWDKAVRLVCGKGFGEENPLPQLVTDIVFDSVDEWFSLGDMNSRTCEQNFELFVAILRSHLRRPFGVAIEVASETLNPLHFYYIKRIE